MACCGGSAPERVMMQCALSLSLSALPGKEVNLEKESSMERSKGILQRLAMPLCANAIVTTELGAKDSKHACSFCYVEEH